MSSVPSNVPLSSYFNPASHLHHGFEHLKSSELSFGRKALAIILGSILTVGVVTYPLALYVFRKLTKSTENLDAQAQRISSVTNPILVPKATQQDNRAQSERSTVAPVADHATATLEQEQVVISRASMATEKVEVTKVNVAQIKMAENLRLCSKYLDELKNVFAVVDGIKKNNTEFSFIMHIAMLSYMERAYHKMPIYIDDVVRLDSITKPIPKSELISIQAAEFGPLTPLEVDQRFQTIVNQSGGKEEQFSPSIQEAIKAGIRMRDITQPLTNILVELTGNEIALRLRPMKNSLLNLLEENFSWADVALADALATKEGGDNLTRSSEQAEGFKVDSENVIERLKAKLIEAADSLNKP